MKVKCVIVLAQDLPAGLAANAAGVLAVTLGHRVPALLPDDAVDASGQRHAAIINIPLPILIADRPLIGRLLEQATHREDVTTVGFSDVAQRTRTYEEYVATLAQTLSSQLTYVGVGLYGPSNVLNRWVGSLPLYGR